MKLGELVSVHKGKKPASITSRPEPGYRRLIQIDDLRPGSVAKFCPAASDEVVAMPNDVILTWDGANAGTSGFGLSGVVGSTLAVLRPKRDDLATAYIGQFLKSQRQYLRERCKGATVPHIDGRVLAALELPLPVPDEQQRIADILMCSEALFAKRTAALELLDALAESIFLDLFGDPLTNTKDWQRQTIGQIGKVITGNTPSRANAAYYGSAIEWIKSDNLNTGAYYATVAEERLSAKGKAVGRTAPPRAILVTCIAGTPSTKQPPRQSWLFTQILGHHASTPAARWSSRFRGLTSRTSH